MYAIVFQFVVPHTELCASVCEWNINFITSGTRKTRFSVSSQHLFISSEQFSMILKQSLEINCAVYYSWTHATQHEAFSKHSFKTKKLDLFCFSADPSHLAELGYSLPLRKGLRGLLAVFWLLVENKNIEMIAHIVLHLKRDTQGNHQENKKNKKIQDATIITLGYPVLSHGIYQWPPCLGFDPQLLRKSQASKGQEMKLPLWLAEQSLDKKENPAKTDHLDNDQDSQSTV